MGGDSVTRDSEYNELLNIKKNKIMLGNNKTYSLIKNFFIENEITELEDLKDKDFVEFTTLDRYLLKIKISDEELKNLNIKRDFNELSNFNVIEFFDNYKMGLIELRTENFDSITILVSKVHLNLIFNDL